MRMMEEVRENRILSRWGQWLPRHPRQVGATHETDAELLPLGDGTLLAVTVDTVAEEIVSGLYREPFTAGRTAVVSSLADLAAVGADALGLLMSVTLPASDVERVQEQVALGIRDACAGADVHVLGGDTNEGPVLVVGCVAVGRLPAEGRLTRVGAAAGDRVYVSGPVGLGGALAAVTLLGAAGRGVGERDYRPVTRLVEGRALRGVATACMDTSDGLVATLDQLARLNDVAIRVTRPMAELLHPTAAGLRGATGLPAFPFLASHHGEFELVFTVPESRVDELERRAAQIGWTPLEVGHAQGGQGLLFRDRPVDGAWIRNLLHETGGDVAAYLRRLLERSPE